MTVSVRQMLIREGCNISIEPDAEDLEGYKSIFLNGGRAGVELAGRIGGDETAEMFAASWKLLDLLDEVSASLETCLIHYGEKMPAADYDSRSKRCAKARKLVDELIGHCERVPESVA